MKYQNRHSRKCSNKTFNFGISNNVAKGSRKLFKVKKKWQIVYNKKDRKFRLVSIKISPNEYVVYTVLNTGVRMELRTAAEVITRCILELYDKLVVDRVKNVCIDDWSKLGKNMIILQGYNHKHLKYLQGEAKFMSLGTYAVYRRNIMLVLSVFGRKEEIEDIFDGLSYLR